MEICSIMEESIHHHYPEAEVVSIPVATAEKEALTPFWKHWAAKK